MTKTIVVFILFLLPLHSSCQIITTIAGNGSTSNSGDGAAATMAGINYPTGGIFDKFGNFYFGTGTIGNSVRKISVSGIITTIAGTGTSGYNGDSIQATAAELHNPQQVTVDSLGNVFISDAYNNRIRKVDVTTGLVTTIAGTGVGGYNGDGIAATAAEIFNPEQLCFDKSGNLFFAESANSRIRKINTSGIISTFAGNGICGYGGNNIPATSAPICVFGLCIDNLGNVYVADGVRRVYKIDTAGFITYYAGNGTNGSSGDGMIATSAETEPFLIKMDKFNNLFICEYERSKVRVVNNSGIISTIIGNKGIGFSGDNGVADSAQVNFPAGIALDTCDNLYISDSRSFRIRKITFSKCNYLSVSDDKSYAHFEVYPNPVSQVLHIDNVLSSASYRIYNIVGAVQRQSILQKGNNTISLQALWQGIYMLELIDEDGNKTVRKIVKE